MCSGRRCHRRDSLTTQPIRMNPDVIQLKVGQILAHSISMMVFCGLITAEPGDAQEWIRWRKGSETFVLRIYTLSFRPSERTNMP